MIRVKRISIYIRSVLAAMALSVALPFQNAYSDDGCTGSCATADSFLTTADVQQVIAQAVAEATARQTPATIAVVDRVGNVLAVFQMNGAPDPVTITSGRTPPVVGGLEGIAIIPASMTAIAKAVTGAYLSSEGDAFTTRTASQIVQEHFNPGETGQPGGPLFGVQFSQLPCSDLSTRFTSGLGADVGPKRSPLGLSADPGGLPLYKNGTPVGAIGVMADGLYSLDLNIGDFDDDADEIIAVAGTFNFIAPTDRLANRITVDGKNFRYADYGFSDLASDPTSASFAAINGVAGNLIAVSGYTDGTLVQGTAFGQPNSGIRADVSDYPGLDAFVLVDNNNVERFRPKAGQNLTREEVRQILSSGIDVANKARAQIRRPLSTPVRVTVSVVDSDGTILGVVRTRDAPIFGTDVSLQKARTAAFFSSAVAASSLRAAQAAVYLTSNGGILRTVPISDYVNAAVNLFQDPNVLTGAIAFSDRAGGNLSRPFFPDGDDDAMNGPFSKPFNEWSPFSDGMQLDLVINSILAHVLFVAGLSPVDVQQGCAQVPTLVNMLPEFAAAFPQISNGAPIPQIANGIQIFPGSAPIYKGNKLVGGIGVSGDGVDQDDMVSFLGLHNASQILGTVNNAPKEIRADTLKPGGVRLRFIQCPQAPLIGSEKQNICQGK